METSRFVLMAGVATGVAVGAQPAMAASYKTLFGFGAPNGGIPMSQLTPDATGALYGTTWNGGSAHCIKIKTLREGSYSNTCGSVFKMTPPSKSNPKGTLQTIYEFKGEHEHDGGFPAGRLTLDQQTGAFYGTTMHGGDEPYDFTCDIRSGSNISSESGSSAPCGTVFKLTPPSAQNPLWTEQAIHYFEGYDGAFPNGRVIEDKKGNLFGSFTAYGPAGRYTGGVFELSPSPGTAWTYTILYEFDPDEIPSDIDMDSPGRIFGTVTNSNGADALGEVYMLSPPASGSGAWSKAILHTFHGGSKDGANPAGDVVVLDNGAIIGTTRNGGGGSACGTQGCGTVYQLAPATAAPWPMTILYRFRGRADGAHPQAPIVTNKQFTTMLGTTSSAGLGYGTVYELSRSGSSANWTETILHRFAGGAKDGADPIAAIHQDPSTDIVYGTAPYGGTSNSGTIYQITP